MAGLKGIALTSPAVLLCGVAALMALVSYPAEAAGTTVENVRLSVRIVPQPVPSGGKWHVVYEAHIENQGEETLLPRQVAVLREDRGSIPVEVYQGQELLANMEFFDRSYRGAGRDYLRDPDEDPLSIGPGMIGVVYVWLTLEALPELPSNWLHEVTLSAAGGSGGDSSDRDRSISLSGGRFTLSARPPVEVGRPLEGGPWWVMESMGNGAVHRRAMVLEALRAAGYRANGRQVEARSGEIPGPDSVISFALVR